MTDDLTLSLTLEYTDLCHFQTSCFYLTHINNVAMDIIWHFDFSPGVNIDDSSFYIIWYIISSKSLDSIFIHLDDSLSKVMKYTDLCEFQTSCFYLTFITKVAMDIIKKIWFLRHPTTPGVNIFYKKFFITFSSFYFVNGEDWLIFVHFNQKNSDPLFWQENETGNGNGGDDALFETLYKG